MRESSTTGWPRRHFIVSGISMFGLVLGLGSVSLLSGCGDDKGDITHPDNSKDATKEAKDSLDYYKNTRLKGGASKKQ